MASSRLRFVVWLLALCMPLQGFGVALARVGGAGHFHLAGSLPADERDHLGHRHATIERHHHDAADRSVVVIDDDMGRRDREPLLQFAAKRLVADCEGVPVSFAQARAVVVRRYAGEAVCDAFDSYIGDPPRHPPR